MRFISIVALALSGMSIAAPLADRAEPYEVGTKELAKDNDAVAPVPDESANDKADISGQDLEPRSPSGDPNKDKVIDSLTSIMKSKGLIEHEKEVGNVIKGSGKSGFHAATGALGALIASEGISAYKKHSKSSGSRSSGSRKKDSNRKRWQVGE